MARCWHSILWGLEGIQGVFIRHAQFLFSQAIFEPCVKQVMDFIVLAAIHSQHEIQVGKAKGNMLEVKD